MAEVVWTEPALSDLDAIADYIALDKPEAARQFVQRVFEHIDHLRQHPELGSRPPELGPSRHRQIIEPPCRVFYRHDADRVYMLYVMRTERLFRPGALKVRERKASGRGRASKR